MDEECVPYTDQPYESKLEEETDNDSYLEDDTPIEIDSDSIQALQTLGEENLINQACLAEFEKGISQVALMRKYGIG